MSNPVPSNGNGGQNMKITKHLLEGMLKCLFKESGEPAKIYRMTKKFRADLAKSSFGKNQRVK